MLPPAIASTNVWGTRHKNPYLQTSKQRKNNVPSQEILFSSHWVITCSYTILRYVTIDYNSNNTHVARTGPPETTRETSHPHLQTNFPSFGNPRAVAARNGWPEGHFSGNYSKHPSHVREVRNIIDSKMPAICMDISSQEGITSTSHINPLHLKVFVRKMNFTGRKRRPFMDIGLWFPAVDDWKTVFYSKIVQVQRCFHKHVDPDTSTGEM